MAAVYFRGDRTMARQAIVDCVRSLTGEGDHLQAAQSVHAAIGLAALSDIKDDFVRKASGMVGEDGVKWPPLSPEYLAYGRRFGSGEKAALKKSAGLGRGHRFRGLLSAAQNKRWKLIFRTNLMRLAASMDVDGARSTAGSLADRALSRDAMDGASAQFKGHAAAIAWNTLKAEGAKTKLEVFGNRQVDILRDTGVLLNSLSPGRAGVVSAQESGRVFHEFLETGINRQPVPDQIFELTRSGVIVGTNVPYASVHQHGSKRKTGKGGGIPARPFLPIDGAPAVWVDRWRRVAAVAIKAMIRNIILRPA